jgi:hypothetical protein
LQKKPPKSQEIASAENPHSLKRREEIDINAICDQQDKQIRI